MSIVGLLLTALYTGAGAQDVKRHEVVVDSVEIHFHQSRTYLDMKLRDNEAQLNRIVDKLNDRSQDSILVLQNIRIVGGASPEGTVKFNEYLSLHRANRLFDYVKEHADVPDAEEEYTFLGRDWEGTLTLMRNDPNVPYKDEAIALLEEIVRQKKETGKEPPLALEVFKRLRYGEPYWYMYQHHFPTVRASHVYLTYLRELNPELLPALEAPQVFFHVDPVTPELFFPTPCYCKPFYMAIKTNMLYDAAAIPNIGFDFYVGRNWSVVTNWLYTWIKNDSRHRYWRAYGGDLEARWWFGSKAKEKPLTGFHVGPYFGLLTYDFEWGSKGYQARRWSKTAAVAFGFSLPIKRRLNLDFTVGGGYHWGKYYEYKPVDGHYVWQKTKRRKYFGPTKLEISLVWLVGCNNENQDK